MKTWINSFLMLMKLKKNVCVCACVCVFEIKISSIYNRKLEAVG